MAAFSSYFCVGTMNKTLYVIGNGAKTTVLTTTDQQKNGNLPTLRKIKRGVLPPHKPTQNTTFNFAPTHPSPPTTLT